MANPFGIDQIDQIGRWIEDHDIIIGWLDTRETLFEFGVNTTQNRSLADAFIAMVKGKPPSVEAAGDALQEICNRDAFNNGWWNDITDYNDVVPHKLLLIHSEVSEATEGHRKDLMDDKLPHRKMLEVELADVVIRVADLCGALGLDLGGAIKEKLEYNRTRADHKPENRAKEGGKSY